MTTPMYRALVQSAAIHPEWTRVDHAEYLWTEHYHRAPAPDGQDFNDLVWLCAWHLGDDGFKRDVESALDKVS